MLVPEEVRESWQKSQATSGHVCPLLGAPVESAKTVIADLHTLRAGCRICYYFSEAQQLVYRRAEHRGNCLVASRTRLLLSILLLALRSMASNLSAWSGGSLPACLESSNGDSSIN